jgi:hypothetical protein
MHDLSAQLGRELVSQLDDEIVRRTRKPESRHLDELRYRRGRGRARWSPR